jgi:hypothetical protein
MSPARRQQVDPLTDEDRHQLEQQTRRNLDGMEHEAAGRFDLAVELYEQNVAERFAGDWPYSRLVSFYERQGAYDQAERVLRRAVDVARADRRRPAGDRRALVEGLQGRLRLLKKTARAARNAPGDDGPKTRTLVSLPIVDNRL